MWLLVGVICTAQACVAYPVDGMPHRTEQACLSSVTSVPPPYSELRCRRTDSKPQRRME